MQSLPASITLNGANLEVGGHKTLEDALRASGIKPKPGDFVAVDGSVIEAGKGEPFHATVNGEVATDMDTKLNNGDVVELGDGSAIEEPSETAEESIPYSIEEEGRGPIHVLEGQGADGLKRTKTGSVSGLTTEEVVQEPSNVVRRNVSPQVGEDKVVALTFDDGPWPESTAAVLDVLADQGAKATFFTVGNRIDGEGVDLVKRAAAEGHQICSHSFDHAAAKGFIQLQTLSAKTWASNRRQEGAPAELFDAQKKVGPLTKGAYEDVTPVWKQVAEAENAAVVEEAEAALQGAAEKA